MNWIKNISKLFISLLVVVYSTISFNYEPVHASAIEINRTELLVLKKDVSSAVAYDFAKKFQFLNYAKADIIIFDRLTQTQQLGTNSLLEYKIQNNNLLAYKSNLLKVVLNDIIQQKSHWI